MLNRSIAQAWTRTFAHLWHWHCSVGNLTTLAHTGTHRHSQAYAGIARHTGTQANRHTDTQAHRRTIMRKMAGNCTQRLLVWWPTLAKTENHLSTLPSLIAPFSNPFASMLPATKIRVKIREAIKIQFQAADVFTAFSQTRSQTTRQQESNIARLIQNVHFPHNFQILDTACDQHYFSMTNLHSCS